MIGTLLGYSNAVSQQAIRAWDQFWFASRPTFDVGIARVAFGILAATYAASWCIDLYDWVDANGILNSSVTRYLIGDQMQGTGSIGRISLLYSFESKWFVQCYLIATILCSLAMAFGIGGRVMVAAVGILTLGIVHRVPMLQGAGDLLFTGIIGYLVIDPGKTKNWWRIGVDDRIERWSSNLAVRLMQCHVLIWLLVSLVSHLAEPMWWSGSAAWWLASAQLSPWYTQAYLSDKPYLINALSHVFILVHLVTIGLLLKRNGRPLAILAMIFMAMGIWLMAGDWFYSLALVLCTSPFWGTAVREVQEFAENEDPSAAMVENDDAFHPAHKKKNIVRRAVLRSRSKGSS